jgi:ADP-L-glycero-D-manno-heptose 6-epimerase
MGKVIVTGGEGFIGSNLVRYLNENGIDDILVVDSADNGYLNDARISSKMSVEEFTLYCITSIQNNFLHEPVDYDAVFHLGAMVDTMSDDPKIMDYNFTFPRILSDFCAEKKIPFLYASSAAVYGQNTIFKEDSRDLKPLNTYAKSKYLFDNYILENAKVKPEYWYGFRFFNVYGPDEWHKGAMISAVTQIYLKAVRDGEIKLFKSVDPAVKDGYQKRDFIHVSKVTRIMYSFWQNRQRITPGIYNLGTGRARTFLEIAHHVNLSLKKELKIRFIDMPESIKGSYQSVTQANIEKLSKAASTDDFDDFDNSIREHYRYLMNTGGLTQ